jgi:hypothetical protein
MDDLTEINGKNHELGNVNKAHRSLKTMHSMVSGEMLSNMFPNNEGKKLSHVHWTFIISTAYFDDYFVIIGFVPDYDYVIVEMCRTLNKSLVDITKFHSLIVRH